MDADRLAIEGGRPALTTPPGVFVGAAQIGAEEEELVLAVVRSRSLFRYYGPDLQGTVARFEDALARRLARPHVLAVSSGTAALRVAFCAAGLRPGDEIVLPAYCFLACATAALSCGIVPVFAECGSDLLLDPERIEARLSPATRAILAVHMNGLACDMDRIRAIAARSGLVVIEDCSQAFGARYRGCEVGTFADFATFSLQYMKTITAGEGGAVVAADRATWERAVYFHDLGFQRPGRTGEPVVGENLRLGELAGAVALAQLARADAVLARTRQLHARWSAVAAEFAVFARRPAADAKDDSGISLVLTLPDADRARFARKALRAENVPCESCRDKVGYLYPVMLADPLPVPFWPPGVERPRYRQGLCPATEDLALRSNAIPVNPAASAEQVLGVEHALRKVGRRLAELPLLRS
jgi:8-amino-3,8-dideoxy-alpha-D-manno-octulosonate transaminase